MKLSCSIEFSFSIEWVHAGEGGVLSNVILWIMGDDQYLLGFNLKEEKWLTN